MEIREIITFLAVADLRSFSKAAQKLDYTQSAVTLQIKRLENDLNTSLFNRLGNKVSLTDEGKLFYPNAQTIVKALEVAKDTINNVQEIEGSLTLGTIESICSSIFPTILNRFHELYPKVDINIITGSPTDLLNDMNNNLIDVVYFMDERRFDSNWVRVLEAPEKIIFASSDLNSTSSTFSLEELVKLPFVLTEKDASYRSLLDQKLASKNLSLDPFLESQSTSFLINFLLKAPAYTFLPEFTIKEQISEGKLKAITTEDFELSIWRQVVYHKNHYLSKPMQALFDVIKTYEQEKGK